MATAKKTAAPAKNTKNAAEVDDLLAGKDDDLLSGKKAPAKKAAKAAEPAPAAKKAPAKKAKAAEPVERAESRVDEIKAVLGKTKKLTTYADIAEANGFDIRAVRRTARAMRDEGTVELVKEGTVVFVKKV